MYTHVTEAGVMFTWGANQRGIHQTWNNKNTRTTSSFGLERNTCLFEATYVRATPSKRRFGYLTLLGRGDDTVGNPHRAQIYLELF